MKYALTLVGCFYFSIQANAVDGVADLQKQGLLFAPAIRKEIILSNGFKPYAAFKGTGYIIEPIHSVHSPKDYKAWHDESFDQLVVLFKKAWSGWPDVSMTEVDNAKEIMADHYGPFLRQQAFAYTVITPDGSRVIGSLYIYPGKCGAYSNVVYYWIDTLDRANVEANFYNETLKWLNTEWPFQPTFYPGPNYSDVDRGQKYVALNFNICQP